MLYVMVTLKRATPISKGQERGKDKSLYHLLVILLMMAHSLYSL